MIYFTGDIHGSPIGLEIFCTKMGLCENDIVVLLGDVGANYYGDVRDDFVKSLLSNLKPIFFCIHGNHEQRPDTIKDYYLTTWHGGKVWKQDRYPNLLFAKDGEIFHINQHRYLVIGGAYSVDKHYRLRHGLGWWSDEQPSQAIKDYVESQLSSNSFDVVLSHTCPYKYVPREMFLSQIDQSSVDNSTEIWLDKIEETINYAAWFCGHWHTNKRIDKMHFLFHDFETDENID